jgi:hypothetical protein
MRMPGSRKIAGGLLTLALAVSTALAQQKVNFDIPAQPASVAIQTWARASGLQVFAAEEHLQGIKTNPVRGDYTPIEAVQLMVQGTGLEVVASGENTVTIRRVNNRTTPGTPPDERFDADQLIQPRLAADAGAGQRRYLSSKTRIFRSTRCLGTSRVTTRSVVTS